MILQYILILNSSDYNAVLYILQFCLNFAAESAAGADGDQSLICQLTFISASYENIQSIFNKLRFLKSDGVMSPVFLNDIRVLYWAL